MPITLMLSAHSKPEFQTERKVVQMSVEIRVAQSMELAKAIEARKKLSQALVFDENICDTDWNVIRALLRKREQVRRRRGGYDLKKLEIDGSYYAELTQPPVLKSENIIYYIHGGAFVLGISPEARSFAEMLAEVSGCRVYTADFSQSPENKYPVALNECEKIFEYIEARHPGSKIAVYGESTGGNIALALTLRRKKDNKSAPGALILSSPLIDLSGTLDRSVNINDNRDFIIKPGTSPAYIKAYAGNADLKSFEVSPYFGDLTVLPPTFIICDAHETLLADSLELDRRLDMADIEVQTICMNGAYHSFASLGTTTPETKEILTESTEFVMAAMEM